jgi:integrase/recombinase XerD
VKKIDAGTGKRFTMRLWKYEFAAKLMENNLSEVTREFFYSKGDICSSHTMADYSLTMRRLKDYFSIDPSLNRITPRDLRAFLKTIPGGGKNKRNAYTCLSSFWSFCLREGYVKHHILRDHVEKPAFIKRELDPFTRLDVLRLLDNLNREAIRDRALICFLLDTGLRASELCELTTDKLRDNTVHVLGKGRKERSVPVSPDCMLILAEYAGRRSAGEFIFQTDDGGEMDRFCLAKILQRIGERAKVPGCHAHRFRHTFAVNYLLNGGDPYTLQRILGHSTWQMVDRYLSFTRNDLTAAHAKASPMTNMGLLEVIRNGGSTHG